MKLASRTISGRGWGRAPKSPLRGRLNLVVAASKARLYDVDSRESAVPGLHQKDALGLARRRLGSTQPRLGRREAATARSSPFLRLGSVPFALPLPHGREREAKPARHSRRPAAGPHIIHSAGRLRGFFLGGETCSLLDCIDWSFAMILAFWRISVRWITGMLALIRIKWRVRMELLLSCEEP